MSAQWDSSSGLYSSPQPDNAFMTYCSRTDGGANLERKTETTECSQEVSKDLTVAKQLEEVSIPNYAQRMGTAFLNFAIGSGGAPIAVHKNLIINSSPWFRKNFTNHGASVIVLKGVTPAAFSVFIELLYTEKLPVGKKSAGDIILSDLIRKFCQLYVFLEKYHVHNELKNKVMDRIQDSFVAIGGLPQLGLILAVHINAPEKSKLREFMIHCLICQLRNNNGEIGEGKLLEVFNNSPAVFAGFFRYFKSYCDDKSPLFRDCGGVSGCSECDHVEKERAPGYWPCFFHVHGPEDKIKSKAVTKGETSTEGGGTIAVKYSCYLWNEEFV